MSQPPQDPFEPQDPPDAGPASTPPPIRAPVRVFAQPLGMSPLSVLPYTMPATNRRPGLVTAMGVASIVIACLGLLSGLASSFMTLAFFVAASVQPVPATLFDPTGPRGHSQIDRRTVMQALNLKQRMTTPQREQLQFFLADVGQLYVPAVPVVSPTNDPVADYAAANVSAAGAGVEGGVYFDLPMGRLSVTDTAAGIALADGKRVTRSATRQMPNPADPSQLSPAEVAAVVNRVQEMTYGQPLTPAQTASLTAELQSNSAALVGAPKDMPTLLGQVMTVTPGTPSATVQFRQAIFTTSGTGTTTVASFSTQSIRRVPRMASTPSIVLIVEGVLSTLLAIYLLVIGILTLRNSPAGARLHRIYAWLKILLTFGGAAALWWVIVAAGGAAPWAWLASMTAMFLGVLYPIVLLFVLPSRSLKAFYAVEHVR